ncbi:threonine/serine exporter ThrE family protein [Pseudoscardovia radai]|uniref:threonine/serine ThrE exporter family protein n=1 Tax=Pseudoscardovia radai TaxID=987066 RepID=UPI0039959F7C
MAFWRSHRNGPERTSARKKAAHDRKVREAAVFVGDQHRHSIPLDMRDIREDLDTPLIDASLPAKTSVIVRAGALDLSGGTGSFRVRELMGRMAMSMGCYVRADVKLTDIEAECSNGEDRMAEVVDLPTTGVNTERIWYMEHFADWLSVNLGQKGTYHPTDEDLSAKLVERLPRGRRHRTPAPATAASASPAASSTIPPASNQPTASQPASPRPASSGRTVRRMTPPRESSVDDNGTPLDKAGHIAHRVLPGGTDSVDSGDYGHDAREKHLHTGAYHGVTVRQVHERLDAIEYKKPLYSPAFAALAAAVACASFVFLLGGGLYDMLAAFIGAGIGQFLRATMLRRHINQFFVVMVSVALAALASIGFLRALAFFDPTALHHDTAYIGAILFVIPGFPLITGGLDIFKMDIQSGIQRMTYFMAIVIVATLSAWAVARCVSLDPQGFDTPQMSVWVRTLLWLLTAFGGVWGFSVLFNSPQKMACVAGIIGAIADTLRLELVNANMPMEAAAFIGALTAGLLATCWRSSVRRGWLPPQLGFPRICLTVPSIVIMVPGLYMYRAVFYLGELDTQATVQWAFEAMLVILMLPIGLAVARVLTDRGWRYDV